MTRLPASETAPFVLSVLRIMTAFFFMAHGTQKLFNVPSGSGPVELFSLLGAAGVIETFGGLLLLVGLFTQPVALIVSGEMAAAYFLRHAPSRFWPIHNHGELAAVYCFIFLYFAFAGGGPLSLDAVIRPGNSSTARVHP